MLGLDNLGCRAIVGFAMLCIAACSDDGGGSDGGSDGGSTTTDGMEATGPNDSTGTTPATGSTGSEDTTGTGPGDTGTTDGTTSTGPDGTTDDGSSDDGETEANSSSGGTTEGVAALPSDPVCAACVAGNRVGFHGMALLGNETHFLAHIPLFVPPHSMQLAARIELVDSGGEPIAGDFSDGEYSLAPNETFSLDDLGLGLTTEFSADVHDGNFEQGAPVLYADVTVSVQAVVLAKELPDASAIADGAQEAYLIGTTDEAYLLNFIRNARPYQQFLTVSAVQGATWDVDGAPRVIAESAGPLSGSDGTIDVMAGDVELSVTIEDEIWCLDGPDFFFPC